eukprot:3668704-Rhodomonas_salina.1
MGEWHAWQQPLEASVRALVAMDLLERVAEDRFPVHRKHCVACIRSTMPIHTRASVPEPVSRTRMQVQNASIKCAYTRRRLVIAYTHDSTSTGTDL